MLPQAIPLQIDVWQNHLPQQMDLNHFMSPVVDVFFALVTVFFAIDFFLLSVDQLIGSKVTLGLVRNLVQSPIPFESHQAALEVENAGRHWVQNSEAFQQHGLLITSWRLSSKHRLPFGNVQKNITADFCCRLFEIPLTGNDLERDERLRKQVKASVIEACGGTPPLVGGF